MPRPRKEHESKEVDLAALVDIFSNMLFFLLATVALLQLQTLNAAVPALSSGAVSTGKAVDVSLAITDAGYVLSATGQPADPNAKFTPINGMTIPRVGGKLDTVTLSKQLWTIKSAAPETKNIIIAPELRVPFDEVIATMDASREMKSERDASKKIPLFTRAVLTETEKADPAPTPAPTGTTP